jgi:hypothetical protein
VLMRSVVLAWRKNWYACFRVLNFSEE